MASLLGGVAALLPPLLERLCSEAGFDRIRECLLVAGPLVLCVLLYMMTIADTEWLYAAGYITFHISFELMRVLCEAQGARCVAATRCQGQPRFAAVSGLNTTLTLSLQVVLQIFFAADFHMLAGILFGLFVAYVAAALVRCLLCQQSRAAAEEVPAVDAEGWPYEQYRDRAAPAAGAQSQSMTR